MALVGPVATAATPPALVLLLGPCPARASILRPRLLHCQCDPLECLSIDRCHSVLCVLCLSEMHESVLVLHHYVLDRPELVEQLVEVLFSDGSSDSANINFSLVFFWSFVAFVLA